MPVSMQTTKTIHHGSTPFSRDPRWGGIKAKAPRFQRSVLFPIRALLRARKDAQKRLPIMGVLLTVVIPDGVASKQKPRVFNARFFFRFAPFCAHAKTRGNEKSPNLGLLLRRRERDSNPRTFNSQRFSRPPHSTALPSLRMFLVGFEGAKIVELLEFDKKDLKMFILCHLIAHSIPVTSCYSIVCP